MVGAVCVLLGSDRAGKNGLSSWGKDRDGKKGKKKMKEGKKDGGLRRVGENGRKMKGEMGENKKKIKNKK